MNLTYWLCNAAAIAGGLLALAVPLFRRRSVAAWLFAVGITVCAVESRFAALSVAATTEASALRWQLWRLEAISLLPGTWLLFSLCYSRGNYRDFVQRWCVPVTVCLALPVMFAGFFRDDLLLEYPPGVRSSPWPVVLGPAGRLLHLLVVLGIVLVLLNLERTFRTAVGTMRWRIKFVTLGLAVLFAARLYTSSQAFVYSASALANLAVNATALLLACALVAVSVARTGWFEIDVYPSHAVLTGSVTVIIAGVYLLVVGVLAKVVTAMGGDRAFPLKAALILVGFAGLALLLLSDRFRQRTRLFVSRHFRRPIHDYRRLWTAFSERTAPVVEKDDLCQTVARLVSETFEVLSVSVWLVDEQSRSLVFGASSTLTPDRIAPLNAGDDGGREVLAGLRGRAEPFDLDATSEAWAERLKQYQPDCFGKGGGRLCVPLRCGDELLGLLTVGDRVSGLGFSPEDIDLLKCLGAQVAARLLNSKLAQRLVEAKQMEAFQTMSAFFVHDLKNAASTLSMMLANFPLHFDNPAFREDALRAIAQTAERINTLMTRLTLLREDLKLNCVETDLNDVVKGAVQSLASAQLPLVLSLAPIPRAPIDAAQMEKVVTNLLLNSRDALGADGRIELSTGRENGWVVLAVKDNGVGMEPEFIARRLFRPFQTTKKSGMGIGMFYARAIVDAHGGRIEVRSAPGKGTTFRVLLPV